MKRLSNDGAIDAWLLMFIVMTLLFIGAISFAAWAYMGRQDFKNNVDQKVAIAVQSAKVQEDTKKDKAFAEQEKLPLRTYVGPSAYGTLNIPYPKTWSAYVDTSGQGAAPLDGYFNPDTVPSIQTSASAFALRVQVNANSYSSIMSNFASQVQNGQVKATPYSFPKVSGIVGTRLDGQIEPQKTGSMIVLPLRDKTLEVWCDLPQNLADFNNIILPNLSFSP